MLKAVRFDIEEHKDIIKFVEDFRDKKNKPNHSEAIRFLMTKGLESLNKTNEPQPIDLESMKSDIFNQIMNKIDTMNIQSPPPKEQVHKTLTPSRVQNHGIKPPTTQPRPGPPPSQSPKKAAINPLLANILGNSERT